MLIGVSGTHGTGKSLFLYELRKHLKKPTKLITELYREIIARTPVSRFTDGALQDLATFEMYVRHEMILEALKEEKIVLVDRHPVDALVYAKFFGANVTKVESILKEQLPLWEDAIIVGFLFGFEYTIPPRLLKPLRDDPVRRETLRLTNYSTLDNAVIEFERLYLQTVQELQIPMKIFKLSDYITQPITETYTARNTTAIEYILAETGSRAQKIQEVESNVRRSA